MDYYRWLDLGVLDIPPANVPDNLLSGPLFPVYGTTNYLRITLDVNEAAAAETFRLDCIELLPDDGLIRCEAPTDISYNYYPLLIDSTDEGRAILSWKWLQDEFLTACEPMGAWPRPRHDCVSRLVVRKMVAYIMAATGGTRVRSDVFAQIEPRFEALR